MQSASVSKLKNFKSKLFFEKKNKEANSRYQKLRGFMSRLSSSFFVVIAIMPFAGLFLGLGSLFNSFEATKSAAPLFSQLGGCLFNNLGIFFALAIIVGFNKDVVATISCIFAYFIFLSSQYLFLSTQNPDILSMLSTSSAKIDILFYKGVDIGIANSNLGIVSLNTGVFGGIMVGAITHLTFNRFKNTKLPSLICFFEGKRFVPLVIIPVVMVLSLIFLIVWPIVNIAFSWIGTASGHLPIGLDSGIIAGIWRLLTPFGLHHAFYSPFWWTSAGGEINMDYYFMLNGKVMTVKEYLQGLGVSPEDIKNVMGDQNIWFFMSKYNIPFNITFYTDAGLTNAVKGINPGRFTGVNYPFMIGGYVGAGLAMYQMAKPENKKQALALIASAVGTSFLIGVTEPMLFMFIFVAPLLFFGFHVLMTIIGAMLLSIMHCHIGAAFSCGLLDLVIYGILPSKLDTNWYMALIPIFAYVPIYYLVFLLYMKKTKVIFPIFEKAADGTSINIGASKDAFRDQIGFNVANLVDGLGGVKNIKKIDNCATRLRLNIANSNLIDDKLVKSTGALHIVKTGSEVQVIYGPKAQSIAQKLSSYVEDNSGHQEKIKTDIKPKVKKTSKAKTKK